MSSSFNHGYGLLIGVGADLPVTISDAEEMFNVLQDSNRCSYPKEQLELLTGVSSSREYILSALDRLALKVERDPDATVIIYFSGHGIESPEYHILPFGYDLSNLDKTAISGKEFTDKLQKINSKKLLILLDCCHAGAMADVKSIPVEKSPLPKEINKVLLNGYGKVVIASSRKDEVSFTGIPVSVFTKCVLEAFAGHGAFEEDGYTRVLDVAMWVGRKVPEYTNDRQHPIVKISNLENNFALAYYAGGAKKIDKRNWAIETSETRNNLRSEEIENLYTVLNNYRENLLLIEERMSEYIEFNEIPLQLIKNKRQIEKHIVQIEQKLLIG